MHRESWNSYTPLPSRWAACGSRLLTSAQPAPQCPPPTPPSSLSPTVSLSPLLSPASLPHPAGLAWRRSASCHRQRTSAARVPEDSSLTLLPDPLKFIYLVKISQEPTMLEEFIFNQHTRPTQPTWAGLPHPGAPLCHPWGPRRPEQPWSPRSRLQLAALPAREPAAQSLLFN